MKKRLLSLLVTALMLCCLAPAVALAATSTVTDPPTIWSWQDQIKDTYGQDSTANVGRIWTDKTVSDDELSKEGITVKKKGENATFLTALSALSSTSNLTSTATAPLDIVLVLDTSSSMNSNYVTTSTGAKVTRLRALKDAAKNFVATIAEQNNSISDADKQHRVAVVTFNSSAATPQAMTVCAGNSANTISTTIENLGYSQGTRSNLGLQYANTVLTTSKRDGAKPVVVFFTDGTPTMSGSFDPDIASPAVAYAKTMKDAGATVYAIGILSDTDTNPVTGTASSASNENKFMHAVSSNYPSATYDATTWTFGDCAASKYYKNATTAEELKQIFSDISNEIVSAAKYPTSTTDGAENESGYITFHDQLGAYMQVTDLSALVYDRVVYTSTGKTSEGLVDTYHFAGEVNSGIGKGDLSDIVVTVTRSNNLATGDLVEVKIPATLIPLRHFNVDLTNSTMSVTENRPISVLYSSGLKDGVADLLANPDADADMAAYIEANTDATTGQVVFYANTWSDAELGDTTSQFNPASSNSFYYFTEDTPIYIYDDADCDEPATQIIADGEHAYCYRHYYYALENGKPVQKFEIRSIPADAAKSFDGAIIEKDGYLYMKAGTARLVHINSLHKDKDPNSTGTASDVLNPKWNSVTNVSAATTVTPHLGNNGKLMVDKPATLEVKKTVEVGEGYELGNYADKSFEFTISVPAAAGKSLQAEVLAADGTRVGDAFTLAFDAQGNATHSIKHGETLKVYGLEADWTYTVSEDAAKLPKGFTQKSATGATGTFVAGQTATASFTNKYAATGTLKGKTNLAGEKTLTGRNWLGSDLFTFKIEGTGDTPNAPLPTDADDNVVDTVSVNMPEGTPAGEDNPVAFSFGDITYDTPGTYYYKVYESVADSKINGGVTASQAVYQVAVTVTDNGDGTLAVAANKTLVKDDKGVEQAGDPTTVATMTFTNTYKASSFDFDTAQLLLAKQLTGREWKDGESFEFKLEAVTEGAPMPESDVATATKNGSFGFGVITYDAAGKYCYRVTEVVPQTKAEGMTYSTLVFRFIVAVTDNGEGQLVKAYVDAPLYNLTPFGKMTFINEYKTTNATFDTADFGLTKQLTGREWKDGESFEFKLEAETEGAPMPTMTTATVSQAGSFNFGTITYDAIGTYEYKVSEVVPQDKAGGMAYDTNVAKFKVTVTDDGEGQLVATPMLVSGSKTFTNKYTTTNASYDTATAGFEKVLSGRDWIDGDSFSFTLTAVTAGAPMPQKTTATVTKADVINSRAPFSFGTMTYETAGTYEYQVTEAARRLAGITYDTHTATVKVTVSDDGEGHLVAAAVVANPVFTNTYGTSMSYTAAGSLSVAKTLTGRDMTDGQFTITVTPDNQASADALGIALTGARVSVPAAADGAQATVDVLAGHDVNFSQANAGHTYTYKVAESYTDASGYTYDTDLRTVSIAVTDDAATATLTATTTVAVAGGSKGTQVFIYTKEGAVNGEKAVVPFYNSYFATTDVEGGTAAQVRATKSLTGRDMAVGEFTFGVHLAGSDRDVLTATNTADGSVKLGSLHYDTKSLAQLVAQGYATRNGDDWTVCYVAYEKTDGLADKGITAMTQPIAFTVTVHDNGDGTLTATANIPDDGLAFANAYATGDPAQVNVTGVKVLAHDDGLTPNDITGKFTFTIASDDPAAPLPTSVSATNDANGNIDFGAISFTLDDLNRALGVSEDKKDAEVDEKDAEVDERDAEVDEPAVDAVALDETKSVSLVNEPQVNEPATDESAVEAPVVNEPQVEEPVVADPVADPEPLVLLSTPVVSDVPVASDDAAAEATNDVEVKPVTEGALEAQPAAFFRALSLFKPATFSAAKRASETVPAADASTSATRSYTFVYTVTETGSVAGVTNDTQVKTVRIKVTDDGLGHLTAELAGEDGEPAFTFTNTYDVVPVTSSVTDQIDVTKHMTGRDLTGGDFTFELLEDNEAVARGSNSLDGTVSMAPVTYTEPGTHHYTLREVGGGLTEGGVTYDGTTYQVDTVVTDNGDGTLAVTHKVADAQDVVFTNSYVAKPTSAVIGAAKVLKGSELKDGQFTFKLVGEGIELTAKNAADGTVVFDALDFDAPGTYEYDVYEVNDGQANVTYDEAKHHVVVTVTDDGEGHLVAEVAGDDALTFTNTYAEPVVPTPEPEPTPTVVEKQTVVTKTVRTNASTPYTGDQVTWTVAALLGACALILAGVALALRRARK